MLDQYFIAKSKEVNTFFGQFALLFRHAQPPHQTHACHAVEAHAKQAAESHSSLYFESLKFVYFGRRLSARNPIKMRV
jgi:hypothetical protein